MSQLAIKVLFYSKWATTAVPTFCLGAKRREDAMAEANDADRNDEILVRNYRSRL